MDINVVVVEQLNNRKYIKENLFDGIGSFLMLFMKGVINYAAKNKTYCCTS